MPFERHHHPLASRARYVRRLLGHALGASLLVSVSLLIGVLGYHYFESLPLLDALVNASMLMGGMGPVDVLHTTAGKWFASAYALYCGLVLLIAASILFAPVLHRLLHSLHITADTDR